MRRPQVPVENVAEIVWGVLLVGYLLGAGHPEYLQPGVVTVFVLSGVAAFVELYLRRIGWRYLIWYDSVVWTILLSLMVAVTGGRSSELWLAYMLMSLTAPSVGIRVYPYLLLGINSLLYGAIYFGINPNLVPYNASLYYLRIGLFFLVAYVVDQSMRRERRAMMTTMQVMQNRVGELVSARDEERKRVAGDIHDWLGTGVVAPMRKLELAMRTADPELVHARVGEVVDTLRRSHEEMRRVMENLHPHLLEQMGAAEALRALLVQWGEEQEIATEFHVTGGPEPPAAVALAAYRIMQEALNNCLKHADAQRVKVRLMLDDDQLTLLISDDGRGFDVPRQGGRGLAGMSERASVFGGRVEVESTPGHGTAVYAVLPTTNGGDKHAAS